MSFWIETVRVAAQTAAQASQVEWLLFFLCVGFIGLVLGAKRFLIKTVFFHKTFRKHRGPMKAAEVAQERRHTRARRKSKRKAMKARKRIYTAMNLGSQGKTISIHHMLPKKQRPRHFAISRALPDNSNVECNVEVAGVLAPWNERKYIGKRFEPGAIYIKFNVKDGKYYLFEANEQGYLKHKIGELKTGTVMNGRTLGIGTREQRFKLAGDGQWYETAKEENYCVTIHPTHQNRFKLSS